MHTYHCVTGPRRRRPSEYPPDGQTRRPRVRGDPGEGGQINHTSKTSSPHTRGPRGERLKSLGSRFRGNDGYEHEAARFRATVPLSPLRTTNAITPIRCVHALAAGGGRGYEAVCRR